MLIWQLFEIDVFAGWKTFVYGWFDEFNTGERTFDSQKMQKKKDYIVSKGVYTSLTVK